MTPKKSIVKITWPYTRVRVLRSVDNNDYSAQADLPNKSPQVSKQKGEKKPAK